MSLRELSNTKLLVVLKEKKHLRNMICANTINHIGSALYNVAMFTLASKQTYSTLAISLANVLGGIPGWIDPILAYMTDRETKRLKKTAILNVIQVLIYIVIAIVMLKYKMPLAVFIFIILATLNCVYRGPLSIVLLIILIATIIRGYLSPKYTTDLVQKIGEEHLTRAESLRGFIFMLADTSGALLATATFQLFSLKNSWLLELGMLVVFMTVGEFMIYKNKRQ